MWPIVMPNDDGIRPAGPADECFYCGQKIGQPHGPQYSVVTKTVRLRYIIEVEVPVPHFWTKEDVEFHRNESTWCADNAIEEIAETVGDGCLCSHLKCEFVSVVDNRPTRELT